MCSLTKSLYVVARFLLKLTPLFSPSLTSQVSCQIFLRTVYPSLCQPSTCSFMFFAPSSPNFLTINFSSRQDAAFALLTASCSSDTPAQSRIVFQVAPCCLGRA